MRLIDADALIEEIENGNHVTDWHYENLVKRAPTIDPVKHAHWIVKRNNKGSIINFWCSSCGPDINYVMDKYCPHCGAKMDAS